MGIILEETYGNAKWRRLWTFLQAAFGGNLSGAASAYEGRMLVIRFEGSPGGTGRRLPRANRVAIGSEFQFADQFSSPGLIDTGADLALHAFKLPLPRLCVRCQFQAAALASQRKRVFRERFANDGRPRTRKPGHRRFGPVHPTQRLAQKFSYAIHEGRDSNIKRNQREIRANFRARRHSEESAKVVGCGPRGWLRKAASRQLTWFLEV